MRVTIGVDYKSSEVSMAVLAHGSGGSVTLCTDTKYTEDKLALPKRLNRLGGRTEALVEHLMLVSGLHVDDVQVAMIEEPGGVRSNAIMQAWGVISAAMAGMGLNVVSYPVSSWRKEVLGKGNAAKEDAQVYVKKTYGLDIEKLDECEAACIADCAMRTAT